MIKKGSGFTNLGKILQANQGSGLGQAVTGGIGQQVQTTQSGIQGATQEFKTEAQKNRLDTTANKQHATGVINRFDPNAYKPDEKKFQVSSGLQSQYKTEQSALAKQQAAAQAQQKKQMDAIVAKQKAEQEELKRLQTFQDPNRTNYTKQIQDYATQNKLVGEFVDPARSGGVGFEAMFAGTPASVNEQAIMASGNQGLINLYNQQKQQQEADKALQAQYSDFVGGIQGRTKALTASQQALENYRLAQEDFAKREMDTIAGKLKALEDNYGKMTASEKNAWIDSEKKKMMAAAAPTEQEIADFTKYRAGVYSGPTTLKDEGTLLGKAAQTQQLGRLAGSSGGRQELLRKFVGGTDYTQGQRQLDETLLGRDQSINLGAAAREARGTLTDAERAAEAARQKGTELVGRAQIFGQNVTKQLEGKRGGLSSAVDAQVKQLTAQNAAKLKASEGIQNILSGKDKATKSLDPTTRMGVALQKAADLGMFSEKELGEMTKKGGYLDRAKEAGLDINKLLAERLKTSAASGLTRSGAASAEQKSVLTALDKLMGKMGTDVEFARAGDKYKEATGKFDLGSLDKYISKEEANRAKKDPAFAKELQQRISSAQQVLGGTMGAIGATTETTGGQAGLTAGGLAAGAQLGAALGAGGGSSALASMGAGPAGLAAMLGTDLLTGGDSTAQLAGAGVQVGTGLARGASGAKNRILESLLKDTKLGKTPAGKEIAKILNAQKQLESSAIGGASKEAMNAASGLSDLTKTGKLDQALAKLSGADYVKNVAGNASNIAGKALKDVGGAASKALFGGKTGNWAVSEYGATDPKSGKRVQVGDFANRSSSEILEAMRLKARESSKIRKGWSGAEGAKALNEMYKYYQEAVKREGNK